MTGAAAHAEGVEAVSDLSAFLLARIAEDEAATFALVPYGCPPGCCAPAGWIGHECLLCQETTFGGTVAAITEIAERHDAEVHGRTRRLAECEAKRRIVGLHHSFAVRDDGTPDRYASSNDTGWCYGCGFNAEEEYAERLPCPTLRALALPYADHPDYRQEWKP